MGRLADFTAPRYDKGMKIRLRPVLILTFLAHAALGLTGCGTQPPSCDVQPPSRDAPILLFNGAGTSPNDVEAIEAILTERELNYATVNSAQLNSMSEAELMAHHLLIVPGGNFIDIGNALAPAAMASVRHAAEGGLNYLGICAGAFIAGRGKYQCFDLTSGVRFGFYSDESRGIRKAAVLIASAGSAVLDQYWEDGPQLSGWGDVVAKYPDGTPAVAQGTCGKGCVILSGVHPEAPANWRHGMTFTTPASDDNAYAASLIDDALQGTPLPHY
jgi:glutamine amidotransferase-like uncharacterized protein